MKQSHSLKTMNCFAYIFYQEAPTFSAYLVSKDNPFATNSTPKATQVLKVSSGRGGRRRVLQDLVNIIESETHYVAETI